MSDADQTTAQPFSGRTAWARHLERPLLDFMRTETGSAAFLLAATVAALVWVNVDQAAYESFWHTQLEIRVGSASVALDLRQWLNSGLMTFFFFVVGLEARREFDIGELRERRRVTLPLLAGLGGMVVPILIYLTLNAGNGTAHGWGTAMSTDTAFALGMLALVGPRFPDRLRSFMLTVVVVDDVAALIVIATVYTGEVWLRALGVAAGLFIAVLALRAAGIRFGFLYALLAAALWVALLKSGVDPVLAGLAMGLITYAYPASRSDLERASDLFRLFREQPTPELARSAQVGLQSAISPNERLLQVFHPWTSYVIVPLFALANAGIPLSGGFLGTRVHVARDARDPDRVRGRQAHRRGRHGVHRHQDQPRPPAAAGRLGGRRRGRRDRGHRLHRLDPDRHARVPRCAARGGEARRAERGARLVGGHLDGLPRDGAAAEAAGACAR